MISSYQCDYMTADAESLLSKAKYKATTGREQRRATRLRSSTLGEGFDPGEIRDVIAGKRPMPKLYAPAPAAPRRVDLIVDIQERLRSGTGALSVELVREKELIHGNLKQGDKLIESIKAWILPPVPDIHDGAWGTIHKLGQVFLRPALFLSLVLDLTAQGVKIKVFVVLVHSHITLYYSIFRV